MRNDAAEGSSVENLPALPNVSDEFVVEFVRAAMKDARIVAEELAYETRGQRPGLSDQGMRATVEVQQKR